MPEPSPSIHEVAAMRNRTHVFRDRVEAGASLAELLQPYRASDAIVFAIPAGGVPVAAEAARRLDLPLDVMVVSKITLPWNIEAGYGAVAGDGSCQLNQNLIQRTGLDRETVEAGTAATLKKVRRRTREFRRLLPSRSVRDAATIVVDDGLASGFTMRTAVQALRNQHAGRIVVAVPTGHSRTIAEIADEADEVYCVNIREGSSFAVADAYARWSDVSEDEVKSILVAAGFV